MRFPLLICGSMVLLLLSSPSSSPGQDDPFADLIPEANRQNATCLGDLPLARQGDAAAQFRVGVCYDYGEETPEDNTEAAKWYRLAAKQGLSHAQHNLGFLYYNGEGVPQNYEKAYMWLYLAAEQGVEESRQAMQIVGRGTDAQRIGARLNSTSVGASRKNRTGLFDDLIDEPAPRKMRLGKAISSAAGEALAFALFLLAGLAAWVEGIRRINSSLPSMPYGVVFGGIWVAISAVIFVFPGATEPLGVILSLVVFPGLLVWLVLTILNIRSTQNDLEPSPVLDGLTDDAVGNRERSDHPLPSALGHRITRAITRRKILALGIGLVALMGLFPPWLEVVKTNRVERERPAGYSVIFSPPKPTGGWWVKIDVSRLTVQWVVVAVIVGGAAYLKKED